MARWKQTIDQTSESLLVIAGGHLGRRERSLTSGYRVVTMLNRQARTVTAVAHRKVERLPVVYLPCTQLTSPPGQPLSGKRMAPAYM